MYLYIKREARSRAKVYISSCESAPGLSRGDSGPEEGGLYRGMQGRGAISAYIW